MIGQPIRWGILSTAHIARKNWRAIQLSGNGVIAAVASRSRASAEKFIAENQAVAPFAIAPCPIGNYAELLAAPDIDAVYIPLPTGLRQEWVLRAAAAGKHIVSEKPCATSGANLREMLSACERHRVQFMDGVMFMHSARLPRMRAVLDDGTSIGPLKRITSHFSFQAPENFFTSNIRAHSALEPLGCLGDLGWYCVRLSLWAAGWRLPRAVTGRILAQLGRTDSPAPVPTDFSGELIFDDGLTADFRCSFLAEFHQSAEITGALGNLSVDDFVLPRAESEIAFLTNGRRIAVAEHGSPHTTAQETNLFRNFAAQISHGSLNDEWPAHALKTQQVINACWQSAQANSQPVALR